MKLYQHLFTTLAIIAMAGAIAYDAKHQLIIAGICGIMAFVIRIVRIAESENS